MVKMGLVGRLHFFYFLVKTEFTIIASGSCARTRLFSAGRSLLGDQVRGVPDAVAVDVGVRGAVLRQEDLQQEALP